MLSIMRKQAGNWMIKVVLFAIVVVFVFWGVGSFTSRQANTVAKVNDEVISYSAYRQHYDRLLEQYRRIYGGALDNGMLQSLNLKEQALNQLIDQVLMVQEAKRLDLQIAEETLDQAIYAIPAFQNNGVFDQQRASFILAQNRVTTAEFRDGLRQDLLIDQLRELVTNSAMVTEEEARQWYDWYNAEVNLNYVAFSPERYKDITLTEPEVEAYFEEHSEQYKTDPQVKVVYLHFDPTAYKAGVKVTDEQITQYYNEHPDEFKREKTVEARHILFKLDEDAEEQTVAEQRKRAEEVFKLAKAGEPFDQLARKHSEGPTRDQGGYLGAFKKDEMVKPFADKAFAMQVGEISDPVRSRFGWHLIKVEKINEAKIESLAEATDRIREKIIDEQAGKIALQKAESMYDAVYDGDDLAAAAQQNQLPVFQTDLFGPEGPREERIANSAQFAKVALGLQKMDISEIQDFGNGYYLIQVTEQKASEIPPLEKVFERVKADTVALRQDELARKEAEKCLTDLKAGSDFTSTAASFGRTVAETGFFKRNGAVPDIGYEPELSKSAFMLQADQPFPDQVFKVKGSWYTIQYKDRKAADADGFETAKSDLMRRLVEQKKQAAFQQWLSDLRANGRIEIKRDVIQ